MSRFIKGGLVMAAMFALSYYAIGETSQEYLFKCTASLESGNYDRAIENANAALKLDAGNADAYSLRGNAYLKKGDHDHAIADYDQAIKIDPTNAEHFLARSQVYALKGDSHHAAADETTAKQLALQ